MQNQKFLKALVCLLFFSACAMGQQRPRLVVGIIVDQMRYDYLYRYWDDMGDKGFKRLLSKGYVIHDGHYQYAPTFTGPGHTSVYTGTSPALNGIIGNEWYSRQEKKRVYCAEDQQANTVGSNSLDGKMSPRRLTATTIADQLELATNRRSKTIGIALKDRGAILPVGFLNDGAYWYDKTNGRFITSDYYRKNLPDWVVKFNDRHLPDQYLEKPWETLLPLERYDESLPDDRPFERPYLNTEKAVFPYDLKKISETKVYGVGETPYNILLASPYGNALTAAFAKAAIEGEELGMDPITDLLALSFSSTDYVGHQFGPHSVEAQDTYLRLDRELADLLDYLDAKIGLTKVAIFLTADHAAADIPAYVAPLAGYFHAADFELGLRKFLTEKFGVDPVENFINEQIYINPAIALDKAEIEKEIKRFAADTAGVYGIIPLHDFERCATDPRICEKLRKGFMPARSGDYYVLLNPGWLPDYTAKGGTTHGSPYAYDTHVPIIFFGGSIPAGDNYDRVWIEDIAPTVCELLKISLPSGCTGSVIGGVLKR